MEERVGGVGQQLQSDKMTCDILSYPSFPTVTETRISVCSPQVARSARFGVQAAAGLPRRCANTRLVLESLPTLTAGA